MIAEKIYNAMIEFSQLTAIKNGVQKKTYEEMNHAGLSIAKPLLEESIAKKNVAIIGDRNFSVYMGILGCLYSSNTYVPINKKYTKNKINKIIQDADIKAFIFSIDDIGFIKDNLYLFNKIKVAIIPDLPKGFSDSFNFNIFSDSSFENRIDAPQASNPIDDIYIMFTSGSPGEPKGVCVSNDNLNNYLLNFDKSYDLSPGYNASQTFDLSFDLSVSDIFYTWMKGGGIIILPEQELFCPSDYIKREKINYICNGYEYFVPDKNFYL